ncbi:MAG: FAD-binding oxidoreductase [Chitinophagaceae bacterium]|nr:FAD-binding oxidoreductase [Chitinophagaceae bacterium]
MDKSIKTLDSSAVNMLKQQIGGTVVLPGDPVYENSRKVYNAMIDKYPAIIVYCTNAGDVIKAIKFAKQNELAIAVRGGGHNGGGLGVCNNGMVIDLSGIKYVRVDPATKRVRVGGGNLLHEVDNATHTFGLAVPAGVVSTTGVGGLVLGGGLGHLSRKYGLSVDNLLEADLVLANGDFVTVNEKNYPDLFWAIKGGGGNFGIVTSFVFQAYNVDMVYGGVTLWPIEQTEQIMAWYDKLMDEAPDELGGFIALLEIPGPPFPENLHHKKFCAIVWCFSGDLREGEKIINRAREMKPVFEHVGPMPFPAMQSMFDGLLVPGLQWYWKADFFKNLSPEIGSISKKFGNTIPTPLSQMHLYPINGAAGRVNSTATPWIHRDAKYSGVFIGVDPDPSNNEKITSWCKSFWNELHPYSSGGSYLNFEMKDESDEKIRNSFGKNYERLRKVKTKYDPENVFRINQNIRPA